MTHNLLRAGALSHVLQSGKLKGTLLAGALLASTAIGALVAAPAQAQQNRPPQKEYYVGEGEVELYRGTFLYSNTDISIGGGENEGGLAFTRYTGVREAGDSGGGPSSGHNLEVMLYRDRFREENAGEGIWSYRFHVVTGRTAETFIKDYGSATIWPQAGSKSTLTMTSIDGPFVYTTADGTVTNFSTLTTCRPLFLTYSCAGATQLVRPNGATLRFAYDAPGGSQRLRLVTNNHGFGIGLEYGSGGLSRACAVNLASAHASVSAPCPTGAPSATYAYGTDPVTFVDWSTYTDPLGQTTHYTYASNEGIATIRAPGSSVEDLTVSYYPVTGRVSGQTYANGATWSYVYQQTETPITAETDSNEWTRVTSPLGHQVLHNFLGGAVPKPGSVTDEIGRTTSFAYVVDRPGGLLERRIEPEGNETRFAYDARDNVTQTRAVAKPGTGLADIVTSSTFPASCTNIRTCNKPTSVTDARGNVTDFTYDPVHGGVLTETGPAVNGVRPQKRYTYAQRYAWVRDSGGTLVQSPDPVWVLTEESHCRTTASCSGGADEVRIVYDYGTTQGPILLRGRVVHSGGTALRTCYGYDDRGNRISETSPRAGLTSCP